MINDSRTYFDELISNRPFYDAASYQQGGTNDDVDIDVSIVTKNCGVVGYLESENMQHYAKYCNFSNFLMLREMNIGLTQPMEPKNGNCVFCMKHKGRYQTR